MTNSRDKRPLKLSEKAISAIPDANLASSSVNAENAGITMYCTCLICINVDVMVFWVFFQYLRQNLHLKSHTKIIIFLLFSSFLLLLHRLKPQSKPVYLIIFTMIYIADLRFRVTCEGCNRNSSICQQISSCPSCPGKVWLCNDPEAACHKQHFMKYHPKKGSKVF